MFSVASELKKTGLKTTTQRLAIYNYIKSVSTHPTVVDIYTALQNDLPAMSLATVYKTVDSLRSHGLIQELNTGGSAHYDADISSHAHIICTSCKKVIDYYGETPFDEAKNNIENELGYTIHSRKIYYYGQCPECSSQ